MKISITLTGTSALLMHNPRMVDPEFEINRQIKLFTSKRKKTDEDQRQISKLEWYGGLYEQDGIIVQPTSKIKKCLINTGKITKQGTAVTRALAFSSLNVPLIYDGPKEIDKIFADSRFTSRLSVGIGNKRVMRTRPSFYPWAMTVSGLFIEDAGLNLDELLVIIEMAGIAEGIGDGRSIGYGRFTSQVSHD